MSIGWFWAWSVQLILNEVFQFASLVPLLLKTCKHVISKNKTRQEFIMVFSAKYGILKPDLRTLPRSRDYFYFYPTGLVKESLKTPDGAVALPTCAWGHTQRSKWNTKIDWPSLHSICSDSVTTLTSRGAVETLHGARTMARECRPSHAAPATIKKCHSTATMYMPNPFSHFSWKQT